MGQIFKVVYSVRIPIKHCDGVLLEVYLDQIFQGSNWPQEGFNCKSLAYELVT